MFGHVRLGFVRLVEVMSGEESLGYVSSVYIRLGEVTPS